MSHPPSPKGATGPEIAAIQRLHQVADVQREPEIRSAPSGAVEAFEWNGAVTPGASPASGSTSHRGRGAVGSAAPAGASPLAAT
jgi:hypothetical protein